RSDFGLAKLGTGGASEVGGAGWAGRDEMTNSPTLIAGPTGLGTILGTAPYMSPEQARGLAVDKRTDIWAFRCVLYEMLTGRRAVAGATRADTLAPRSPPIRLRGSRRSCGVVWRRTQNGGFETSAMRSVRLTNGTLMA